MAYVGGSTVWLTALKKMQIKDAFPGQTVVMGIDAGMAFPVSADQAVQDMFCAGPEPFARLRTTEDDAE